MAMDYKNLLNDRQYEAVSASDKYLRIIAGAGSGKTRVLTYRIAYLIEQFKVAPFQILAITFTNKVAKEMKERTLSLLPDYDLTGLTISTFHSWCARFLRSEIQVIGFPRNYVIYDDEDQMHLIKEIGLKYGYKKGDAINKQAFSYISKAKSAGKLPSDIDKNSRNFNETFFNYFVDYEKAKNEAKALDFDDLLIYTVKILEQFSDIRERYRNRYHDVLIDEFQDTNDLQFKLLSFLIGKNTNLYVVGDPDQTIYTWRGANQRLILDMDKVFVPLRSIVMDQNYRSTNQILTVANKLISNNKMRLPKDLFTTNMNGKPVTLKNLDSGLLEAQYVASSIEEIMKRNPDATYKDFAILYRSSFLSLKIENALVTRRIPYNVYGGLKFYSRKEIKDCLAYFRLMINPLDDVSFDRIVNVPKRGLGEKTLETFKSEANKNHLSYLNYIYEIYEHESLLKETAKAKLVTLGDKIKDCSRKLLSNDEAYSETLNDFLKDIGYIDYLSELDDDDNALDNVNALIDDIRTYLKNHQDSTFDEYLQNVTLLTGQDDIDNSNKVSLMTVHTAKGLEFDYVFCIGLNDGVFPNARAINERTNDGLEEERRLAYVAFTRAKKELYITLNKDYSYTVGTNNLPSRFIKESGLELPKFGFGFSEGQGYRDVNRLYKVDLDKYSSGSGVKRNSSNEKSNQKYTSINAGNNITWKVGDTCIHKLFGVGTVTEVKGDIIVVNFLDFGTKKLLGSHQALSKKGD